jgi:hypothetical protein
MLDKTHTRGVSRAEINAGFDLQNNDGQQLSHGRPMLQRSEMITTVHHISLQQDHHTLETYLGLCVTHHYLANVPQPVRLAYVYTRQASTQVRMICL